MRLHDSQLGDAYQDGKKDDVRQKLGNDNWASYSAPYLNYVKSLSKRWPQLELLADFMEVGTVPTRWCIFPGEEKDKTEDLRFTYSRIKAEREAEQARRAAKMNVALLKFEESANPALVRYSLQDGCTADDIDRTKERLRKAISDVKNDKLGAKFSLFVVEDLSRYVIEILGSELAIDPRFFRSHITDYVWNNIRDRWREPSILQVDAKRQRWFQLRLIRSRYFENQAGLTEAKKEVNQFNILRRLDADRNQIFWDKDPDPTLWERVTDGNKNRVDAKVGHMRSRATFWLNKESTIGVILMEPTPKAGYSLWRGYPNWDDIPPFESVGSSRSLEMNGAKTPPRVRAEDSQSPRSWFEDYIFWAQKTGNFEKKSAEHVNQRLSIPIQCLLHLIDWGISNPSFFPESAGTDHQKQSLEKLHFWRRWVPQARDMLQATMSQVIECNDNTVSKAFKSYEVDLEIIKKRLEDYETRIDRLSTVVNSTISLTDASNTSKLTMLASFFIPPSLVATLLSMNMDPLSGLGETLKWWVVASVIAVTILFTIGYLLKTKKAEALKKKLSFSALVSELETRVNHSAATRTQNAV
ncbi:hypothetical protein FBEOM_7438 [Fusarium beomiforme]|uniref:Uncharacterized protein n=1 Tax=Fusarium beomiforme TaxID=44412 RepID=A0A9P5AH25_9HYPO|nr:hypothetical protein FBEOM_7438 [Fusarium beomiforme]